MADDAPRPQAPKGIDDLTGKPNSAPGTGSGQSPHDPGKEASPLKRARPSETPTRPSPAQSPGPTPARPAAYGGGFGANTGSPIDDIMSDMENEPGYQGGNGSGRRVRRRDDDDDRDDQNDSNDESNDDDGEEGLDESRDESTNQSPDEPRLPEEPSNPVEAGEGVGGGGSGEGAAAESGAAGAGSAAGGAAGAGEGAAATAEGATATAEGAAAAAETAAVAAEATAATGEAAAGTAAAVEATPVVAVVLGVVALVLLLLLVVFPAMGSLFGGDNKAVANPTGEISGDVSELAQQILDDENITAEGNPQSSLQAAANGNCSPTPQTGGCVMLDVRLLQALLTVAQKTPLVITSLATGNHTTCSNHYEGRAADLGSTDRSILEEFRTEGANELLGPGDEGHSTHLHVGWDGPHKNCE